MLVRRIPFFDTAALRAMPLADPSFLNEGAFCLSPISFPSVKKEGLLLSVGDALTLSFVHRHRTDEDEIAAVLRKDNCFYEQDEVWALLASMTMRKRIDVEEVPAEGLLPAGATYSVSEDGIRFQRGGKLFHVSRNPSAYAEKDGTISLYAGYGGSSLHGAAALFRGTSFDTPFVFEKKDEPPACTLPTRPTTECPSLFQRNGYRYMLYGFTGYRRSLTPDAEEMVDAYPLGEEIYEGLGVPMVCEMNGRHIMAGWPKNAGWGAMIIHRELIDEENGRLGMKWMPELVPEVCDEVSLPTEEDTARINLDVTENYLFSATVFPSENGIVVLKFLDDTDEGCEWRLDVSSASAQFADAREGLAPVIPSMRELLEEADPAVSLYFKTGVADLPVYSRNFSISHLMGLDSAFPLRVLLRYSRKTQATYIDVEIGGRRTMLSGRNGLRVSHLLTQVRGGAAIKNAKLSRLKHRVE